MANNKGNPTELNHVEAYVGESDKRLDGGAFFFSLSFPASRFDFIHARVYIYIYKTYCTVLSLTTRDLDITI